MLRIFSIACLLVLMLSCRKEAIQDQIPNVFVNVQIDLNDPRYNDLAVVGGRAFVDGGVRGIVIYHNSSEQYFAYDRNCSYQALDDCARVGPDSVSFLVVDSCCGSQFQLQNGAPFKGPATQQLKEYSTYVEQSILRITNF